MVSAQLPDPVPAEEYEQCPVTDVLRRVGDKWSVLVIVLLGKRAYRFNELHRAIETISQRMLTRTLRGLEADGLVHREVFATVPPSVEYSLTPLGRTCWCPCQHWPIGSWNTGPRSPLPGCRALDSASVHGL